MLRLYGTGFPVVGQPTQPGRRIYPPPCKLCSGKGRINPATSAIGIRNDEIEMENLSI
jgi:hypothetical protein